MSASTMGLLSSLIMVVFAVTVIFVRVKASNKPTNAKKILIPPLGMSTGFFMFIDPQTHDPIRYAMLALVVGVVFSYPLIATSKMYISNDEIYLKRSKWFVVILLALLALRMALHSYVEHYVNLYQTGSLFFILAFGMILPWRVVMYIRYRKLCQSMEHTQTATVS